MAMRSALARSFPGHRREVNTGRDPAIGREVDRGSEGRDRGESGTRLRPVRHVDGAGLEVEIIKGKRGKNEIREKDRRLHPRLQEIMTKKKKDTIRKEVKEKIM